MGDEGELTDKGRRIFLSFYGKGIEQEQVKYRAHLLKERFAAISDRSMAEACDGFKDGSQEITGL